MLTHRAHSIDVTGKSPQMERSDIMGRKNIDLTRQDPYELERF